MKIAITGGTGLIGRTLATRLLERGHGVVVTSRRPPGSVDVPAGVRAARWDCRSADELAPILDGVDAFVHLAGENIGAGRWTDKRKERIRASRVESTAAVANAFERCSSPPSVLLQASAIGIYGPRDGRAIDESAPDGDDFLARVCREWEDAGAPAAETGARRVVARTGVVLDTEEGALPRIVLPFKFFAGGPVGSGEQVLSWIHIADEVGAMVYLLETEAADGAFNLTAPNPVTNRELARAIGRRLGRPSFLPTPGFVLELLLGEMSTLVLDGQRALPARLLEIGYEHRYPDLGAALADLLE